MSKHHSQRVFYRAQDIFKGQVRNVNRYRQHYTSISLPLL